MTTLDIIDDLSDLSVTRMTAMAWQRFAQAIYRGLATDAVRWMRVHQSLLNRAERALASEAPAPNSPAPAPAKVHEVHSKFSPSAPPPAMARILAQIDHRRRLKRARAQGRAPP